MSDKINIGPSGRNIIFYMVLTALMLAVYLQVHQFDFVNIDDSVYVTENDYIRSGLTLDGIRWAFTTLYAEFWHPLTWLSLMLDYELYGLHAGGYHLTNLFLHIISSLLLFGMFQRMTGAFWPSAFVAAFFSLHPLRVESVAWVAERKDVLSVFFWMLTLYFYALYTEKPVFRRYLAAVFFFACSLMSKPLTVTLPVIMMLLDYWPLKRFASRRQNLFLWQLKEKLPFFLLSAVFSLIAIYAQPKFPIDGWPFSLESRIINAIISFVLYLQKLFWPYDLAICYPFFGRAPAGQIIAAVLLFFAVSAAVVWMMKKSPCLLVGWLWFIITILPVIGIIPAGNNAMADRYLYLPSIGIAVMIFFGIPLLVGNEKIKKFFLLPAALIFFAVLSGMTWHQCGFWKNSEALFRNASRINEENALAHINYGNALAGEGRLEEAVVYYNKAWGMLPETGGNVMAYNKMGIAENKLRQLIDVSLGNVYTKQKKYQEAVHHYTRAIAMRPITPDHVRTYNFRGTAYSRLGRKKDAIRDFNEAIRLDRRDYRAYNNRGLLYAETGLHRRALQDFNQAVLMNPNNAELYKNRGIACASLKLYQNAFEDFEKALTLVPDDANIYYNRGVAYIELGRHQEAFSDFNEAIRLKADYTNAYHYRGGIYLMYGYAASGCDDARKACQLGNCEILEAAGSKNLCR